MPVIARHEIFAGVERFAIEDADSPYANILTVRVADKANPALVELAKALTSKEVVEYINKEYKGSIVPTPGLNM